MAASSSHDSHDEKRDAQMLLELTNGIQGDATFGASDTAIPEKWRIMMEANEAKIRGLVDVFFEVVYPMYVPPCHLSESLVSSFYILPT
jgi:hypothetical protein